MSTLDPLKSLSPFRISGKKLTQLNDEYGCVTVIESRHYLTLTFDMIYEQSKLLKASTQMPVHHYIRAMLMSLSFTCTDKVLILGLGGGCLVRAINAYDDKIIIDAVELRETVMKVAMQYFGSPESPKISYHIKDARDFMLSEHKEEYDIIFSDLYSEDSTIPLQSQGSFLVSCAKKVTVNGWLVMNYHITPDVASVFSHALYTLFKTVMYCTTPSGNVIIYASKIDAPNPLSQYQALGNSIGKAFNCDVSTLAKKISIWPKPF
jgi:spermidine synthase